MLILWELGREIVSFGSQEASFTDGSKVYTISKKDAVYGLNFPVQPWYSHISPFQLSGSFLIKVLTLTVGTL